METGSYPKNCAECRAKVPMETRQQMGCAYEPAVATAAPLFVLMRGNTPMLDWGTDDAGRPIQPSQCPFYEARLPALYEAQLAAQHREHGLLEAWCGSTPTRPLLTVLAMLRVGEREYSDDPNRPKGGA